MASKYCVIRYVPNPLADERINVGVIAFDERQVRVRFLDHWNRVRHFADRDIDFLRAFAREIEAASAEQRLLDLGTSPTTLPTGLIETMASRWTNSIQLSEPRASLAPVDQTLDHVATVFLSKVSERRRGFRDHKYARLLLRRRVKEALERRVEQEHVKGLDQERVDGLLASREIRGQLQTHRFDLVLANASVYAAASGLSFEKPEPSRNLQLAADALAWSIDDVRQRQPALPIGVVMLPPAAEGQNEARRLHDESSRIYRALRADVVAPGEAKTWAKRIVSRIPL